MSKLLIKAKVPKKKSAPHIVTAIHGSMADYNKGHDRYSHFHVHGVKSRGAAVTAVRRHLENKGHILHNHRYGEKWPLLAFNKPRTQHIDARKLKKRKK